jgi:carnitine O-acetyltransferase
LTDGFFDAGMLLHALRGLSSDRDRADKPAKRRPVGKKLKLNEY